MMNPAQLRTAIASGTLDWGYVHAMVDVLESCIAENARLRSALGKAFDSMGEAGQSEAAGASDILIAARGEILKLLCPISNG